MLSFLFAVYFKNVDVHFIYTCNMGICGNTVVLAIGLLGEWLTGRLNDGISASSPQGLLDGVTFSNCFQHLEDHYALDVVIRLEDGFKIAITRCGDWLRITTSNVTVGNRSCANIYAWVYDMLNSNRF